MKTDPLNNPPRSVLTVRFHLTHGSVHSFVQTDDAAARKLWEGIDPARLFARPRIVVGSEHSKAVFVPAETLRVDFLHHSFFFSSRRRHTRFDCDWSSDVCSSD